MRVVMFVAGLLAFLEPGTIQAQALRRISSTPACPDCRLQLTKIAEIGTDAGSGMIENENSWVVRDRRGRYFVVHSYATAVKVYGADGRFLQLIGRKGSGPGEFEGISGLYITSGDTVRVLDYTLSRQSVFAPNLSFVRSTPLALAPQLHSSVFGDGRTVVNVNARSPNLVGFPLHTLDTTGSISISFGSESGLFRPDIPGLTRRVLANHSDHEIWVAHERSYEIERWNAASGKPTARFVRDAQWFPNGEVPRSRAWDGAVDPPEPSLLRLHETADSYLWVLTSIADRRWKSAVSSPQPGHFSILDIDLYKDYMLEVIDWRKGKLLFSVRYDKHPGYMIGDGIFAGLVQETDGRVTIPIYRATIAGGAKR